MKDGKLKRGAWLCGIAAGAAVNVPSCADLLAGIVADAKHIIGERLATMAGRWRPSVLDRATPGCRPSAFKRDRATAI